MFDIGFSELLTIAVVALIVIGPERLPKAARTMGHLFGRLQRYVNDVKSDINREMELDELRKLQQQVKSAADDIKSSMEGAARDVESGVKSVEDQFNAATTDNATSPESSLPEPPPGAGTGEAGADPAEPPPRQPSLPGFDRI